MVWSCKFCTFTSRNRRIFLRHYKIKHEQHGRLCPFPCLYSGCPCSFRSQVGLRNHLISQHETLSNPVSVSTRLVCELCIFCEFTNLSKYFAHLGKHTKNKETVNCPFKECSFKSSVYNTFKAHKSKYHCASGLKDLRVELISYGREDSTDSIEAESTGNDLELSLAEESEPQDLSNTTVAAEFRRIMAKDLGKAFFDGLDEYVPTFLQLYRERCSGDGALKCLVESLDADNSNQRRREVVLLGLPHYVREQPSKFLKNCEPLDEDDVIKGMDVGLLIVSEENPGDLLPKEIIDVAIVLEEQIVLDDLKDVSQGFAHLMGLLYVLNISYPKELKYTFEVVQKVIMKIGGDTCSSRVHAVRKKLLLKNQ